jgi:hypothetical protein
MQPGDVSRYGVTQNPNAEMITANALVGAPAGSTIENAAFGSAAGFSTAPYVPPLSQAMKRLGFCKAKGDTCKARAVRGTDLCIFHSPGQGRLDRIGDE